MKVTMKRQTRWNGESLRPGDVIDVDGTTGNRWIAHKIAESVHVPVQESGTAASAGNKDSQEPLIEVDFGSMKINDLRKRAKERNIKFTSKTKKSELIDLLMPVKPEADETSQKPQEGDEGAPGEPEKKSS